MKEFLNETLVLERNMENDFSLMKSHISERLYSTTGQSKKKKAIFFELPSIIRKSKTKIRFYLFGAYKNCG